MEPWVLLIVRVGGVWVAFGGVVEHNEILVIHRYLSKLAGFVTGSYITRDECDAAFDRMHRRDAIGDRVHLVLACVAMVGILGPVSVMEIAVLPMVGFFLVRVANTFPVWIHGFGQPLVLAALMLAGLMGLSLMWSLDPAAGLEHIGELRWLALIGFVYPVIEHRRVLIACLCIGFFLGNLAQIVDAFDGFGNPWLWERLLRDPNRMSGWWDPAVGGSLLVGALGLHLPAALMGKGRGRVMGLTGAGVTVMALVATGTRGAWIASAVLIIIAIALGVRFGKIRCVYALILGGVMVIAGGVLLQLEPVAQRVAEARQEIGHIFDGDLTSSTGARISVGIEAIDAGLRQPASGIGAGSFERWMIQQTESTSDDFAHAHNSLLQLFAEHGVPGVVLGGLLVLIILVNSWRVVPADERGTYAFGPFLAGVGIVLVSGFDSVLLNANTAVFIGALGALSPAYIPKRVEGSGAT